MQAVEYIIKGDVSGIQNFIFNVSSEKAAKKLKSRSLFVKIVCELAVELIKVRLGVDIHKTVIGGGSFYLFTGMIDEHKLYLLLNSCRKDLRPFGLGITIVGEAIKPNYQDTLAELNRKLSKLAQRPIGAEDLDSFFQPTNRDQLLGKAQVEKIEDFARKLRKANGYSIKPTSLSAGFREDRVILFGFEYLLSLAGQSQYSYNKKLDNSAPIWHKDLLNRVNEHFNDQESDETTPSLDKIIEFGWLAYFAKLRTGTDKLGIVKLDVDNLGQVFKAVKDVDTHQKLSERISTFFNDKVYELLQGTFVHSYRKELTGSAPKRDQFDIETGSHRYSDNLYILYSGGDDFFMIGAWDAALEFLKLLQGKFDEFQEREVKPLAGKKVTFSAAFTIVAPQYPVIRFATMVEDALNDAKLAFLKDGVFEKDAVDFLGQPMRWEDFHKVVNYKNQLWDLIVRYKEPRGLTERITSNDIVLSNLREKVENQQLDLSAFWKFRYNMRNGKPHNQKRIDGLLAVYEKDLIGALSNKKPNDSMLLPAAARWTEFLTRNI